MSTGVFPFLEKYNYVLKSMPNFNTDINITSVVIPAAYKNKTCFLPDNVNVYDSFDEMLNHVDNMIFLPLSNTDMLYCNIKKAILNKKDIFCGVKLENEKLQELVALSKEHDVEFHYYINESKVKAISERADPFTQQESVIIAVSPLMSGLNTSETVVDLYNELIKKEYSVGVIATEPELNVFGVDELPIDELIESNLDNTILNINRFFNLYQVEKRPNIILLQLPCEGIHRFSENYATCFGAKTYLISQAVNIDYCALLVPRMDMYAESYEELSVISECRYGFGFDSIVSTTKGIDMFSASASDKTMVHYYDLPNGELSVFQSDKGILFVEKQEGWASIIADNIISSLS